MPAKITKKPEQFASATNMCRQEVLTTAIRAYPCKSVAKSES
jgi:hypothetical protein